MNPHALQRLRDISSGQVPANAMVSVNILDLDGILLSHLKIGRALKTSLALLQKVKKDFPTVAAKEKFEDSYDELERICRAEQNTSWLE
jgi:hypothetical protein